MKFWRDLVKDMVPSLLPRIGRFVQWMLVDKKSEVEEDDDDDLPFFAVLDLTSLSAVPDKSLQSMVEL